jgi:hypothetical protein
MLQHARMTFGLVYELGFHDFSAKSDPAPEPEPPVGGGEL